MKKVDSNCTICNKRLIQVGPKRLYCDSCAYKVRIKNRKACQDKRNATYIINSVLNHKGTIDPKWLVRGTISNYSISDSISNGG